MNYNHTQKTKKQKRVIFSSTKRLGSANSENYLFFFVILIKFQTVERISNA